MERGARVGVKVSHGRKERARRLASRAWFGVAVDCISASKHDVRAPLDGIEDDPCAVLASAEDREITVASQPTDLADENVATRWIAEWEASVDRRVKLSAKVAPACDVIVVGMATETIECRREWTPLKIGALSNRIVTGALLCRAARTEQNDDE